MAPTALLSGCRGHKRLSQCMETPLAFPPSAFFLVAIIFLLPWPSADHPTALLRHVVCQRVTPGEVRDVVRLILAVGPYG